MKSYKLLMADDDIEDREILKDAFEEIGAKDVMGFCENGEQLLEILEQLFSASVVPRLIVLDLNMPRLSGIQTLEFLKKDDRFKSIPVIIYSTSINLVDKEKSLSLGAHSYIAKPLSFAEGLDIARTFFSFCKE